MAMMVFIPYTPGPAAVPGVYEPWLRAEDNPFFNRIPGIGEYSNWKIVAPDVSGLPWTHFDFLGLGSPDDLERVWFNPELEAFRRGWVARWGYAPVRATATPNLHCAICESSGAPVAARARYVEIRMGHGGLDVQWMVTGAVRKHYAYGPAPAGEAWRCAASVVNPLGCDQLDVRFHAARPVRDDWSAQHLLAECIAAPGMQ